METVTPESISIVLGQEDDGRWWADIESMPGVMAYGSTREAAISAVRALALRVAADCIDHGEDVPPQFERVFSVASVIGHRQRPRGSWRRWSESDGQSLGKTGLIVGANDLAGPITRLPSTTTKKWALGFWPRLP